MLRIGRASVQSPLAVPYGRDPMQDGIAEAWERMYHVKGREYSTTAQTQMDVLEKEALRYGAMWCEDTYDLIPAGHYELTDVSYEKPGGAPRKRTWGLSLVKKNRPLVVLQAEDNYRSVASLAALASADEAAYVAYTATATETPVLRLGVPTAVIARYNFHDDPGPNLLLNPGFETYTTSPGNPDNWTGADAAKLTKETVNMRSGASAVKQTQPAVAETLETFQSVSGLSAVAYQASAWFRKNPATANSLFRVRNTTDAVDVVSRQPSTLIDSLVNTYTKLGGQWVAVAGKTYRTELYSEAGGSVAGDVVIWDDATLTLAKLTDVSGNGQHAPIVTASASFPKMGVSDGLGSTCYQFEEKWSYDQVPLPDLGLTGSMNWWMRVRVWLDDVTPSSGSGRGIVLKGSTSGSMGMFRSETGIIFHARDTATGTAFGVTDTAPVQQAWTEYVFHYDYANLRTYLYKNGGLYGSAVIGTFPTAPPGAGTWKLGGAVTGSGNVNDGGFTGKLGLVEFGTGNITADQAAAMYAGMNPLSETLNLPSGSYRVLARVQSRTTVTQKIRATLYDHDGNVLTTGAQVTAGAGNADTWVDVDLGVVVVPDSDDQSNFLEVSVQANADLNPVWIDRVKVVPV